ncbi:MAG: hypothetical protein IPN69_13525 [Acidobacteria bacterium]|nr:hypothetical protein [Acidobacteriota bacterium]
MAGRFVHIFAIFALFVFWGQATAQRTRPKPAPTPRLSRKSKPVEPEIDSKTRFHQELVRIQLEEDENWREFEFPDFNFKASFPRTPAQNSETFVDEVFGTTKLEIFLGLGDSTAFGIGHMKLPYAVTDPEAMTAIYRETADAFLEDGEFKVRETADVEVGGGPALKLTGKTGEKFQDEFVMHVFLVKRDVYFSIVVDNSVADLENPKDKGEFEKLAAKFLDSFSVIAKPEPEIEAPVPPVFRSTLVESVFRSEFFRFTIDIPKSWHRISRDEAARLLEVRRGVVNRNAGSKLVVPKTENPNLLTFTLKPVGLDSNSSLECNLSKLSGRNATAYQSAMLVYTGFSKLGFYNMPNKPVREMIGGVEFIRLEGTADLAGTRYRQKIYFLARNGYTLAFTLTAFSDDDENELIEAFKTIRFETK